LPFLNPREERDKGGGKIQKKEQKKKKDVTAFECQLCCEQGIAKPFRVLSDK